MPNLTAKDFAGLSPEQMSQVSALEQRGEQNALDIAKALSSNEVARKQLQLQGEKLILEKQRIEEQAKQHRIQNKIQLLGQRLNDKIQQKKNELQEMRTKAYEKTAEAQVSASEAAEGKSDRETQLLDRQIEMLDQMGKNMIQTNRGEMPVAQAVFLEQSGIDVGAPNHQIKIYEDPEGTKGVFYNTKTETWETKKLGESAEAEETLEKRMQDVEDTVLSLNGVSAFNKLDPNVQQIAIDQQTLGYALARNGPYKSGQEAGTKATNMITDYIKKLDNIPEKGRGFWKRDTYNHEIVKYLAPIIKKTYKQNQMADFEVDVFHPDYIKAQIMKKGYDEEEAEAVLDSIQARILGE